MPNDRDAELLTVGLVQIVPVWLDREGTLEKVADYVRLAAQEGCRRVVFGEVLVPGYPFWIERQNFDPSGHYSRPDVTRLTVKRMRQAVLDLVDAPFTST
ncbi:MAG: nitrilase-related carbon-nitrogen hydrolase [Desulfobacterales bacterium]|jgi:nitrilase